MCWHSVYFDNIDILYKNDTEMIDFKDSKVAKCNELLSDLKSLQVILYYYDFEVCNPLGSRMKKHKLS